MAAIISSNFRLENANNFRQAVSAGAGSVITSGNFVIGQTYTIVTLGDLGSETDFTDIGSANNTIGTSFVATGVGEGTGTAKTAGSKAYVFIGKSDPWGKTLSNVPDDIEDVPTIPFNTVLEMNDSWQNMIAMKEITSANIINMVPRHDWISKIYKPWSDRDETILTVSSESNEFYVSTSDYRVYKCLYSPGTNSTVMPNHTTTEPITLADDYVWKYMYTIPSYAIDFMTNNYMPVKTVVTQPANENDPDYPQWIAQQASAISATKGGIFRIEIVNPDPVNLTTGGESYNSNPSYPPIVTILGDGTGATAHAVVNTVSPFNITEIIIDSPGSGYSVAYLTIADQASAAGGGYPLHSAVGNNAYAEPILSPNGGHGTDPARELGGFYIGIKVSLKYSENGADPHAGAFIVDGAFRQIGIVKNPLEIGGTTLATDTVYNALRSVMVSGMGPNYSDQINGRAFYGYMYQDATGAKAWIDSFDPDTGLLKYHQNDKTGYIPFTLGAVKTSISNSVGPNIDSFITDPEDVIGYRGVQPFTGQVLFLENRRKIDRAYNQIEDVKIIIEF
jgi:hypothetical protein